MHLESFMIDFDPQAPLERLVAESGNDWVSGAISDVPLETGLGSDRIVQEVGVAWFDTETPLAAALAAFAERARRPAGLRQLFAFNRRYPDLQRRFPVIALGSFWQRREGYPKYYPWLEGRTIRQCLDLLQVTGTGAFGACWRYLTLAA